MFCMKCGTNNPDASAYCMKCGAPMAGQVVTASGAGAAAAPAATSTARRVGAQLVVPRAGVSLPPNCIKCGKPSQSTLNKTFWWHNPVLFLIALISPIIYVIVALIVRKSCRLDVPLCEEHRDNYTVKRRVGGLTMIASLLVPVVVGVIGKGSDNAILAAILLFPVLLIAGAIVFGLAGPIKPTNMDEQTATFKGAGESFLQLLPS
jgi:zinc ribbon protein